jgi:hypothetical protein
MKHFDYFWLRTTIKITVIVFVSQLLLTMTGVVTREPGFEWVIWAAFAGFCAAIAYIVLVAQLNRKMPPQRRHDGREYEESTHQ